MNKRQFDLGIAIFVGCYAAMTGFRLWSTRYLIEGKPQGVMHVTAEVTKAITG
jgi:hypothetical protein